MPSPSPSWDTVPVFGTYRKIDGTPHAGSVRFTINQRVVSSTDDVIFPSGSVIDVTLDAFGAFNVDLPATDDPDNMPADWSIKVEERLTAGGGLTYQIQPKLAMLPTGLDLAAIVTPPGAVPTPALVRGVAGGVAGLDEDGDVVDASGAKVASGGLTSVTIDSISDAGPTGKDLLRTDGLADARNIIYPDSTFAGTYASLPDKPTIPSVNVPNGVAGLDANGHTSLAVLPSGSVIHVESLDGGTTWKDLAGNTITGRPTSRTDVRVACETTGTELPSWAVTGDLLLLIED